MKKIHVIIGFTIIGILIVGTSIQKKDFLALKGHYLGQKLPGMTPDMFAPGVVSTNDLIEMGCTWTPDGREFYFDRSETLDIGSNWAI